MKRSAFNFCYQRENGENVVYNAFSKALFVLEEGEYAFFQKITPALCDSEMEEYGEVYAALARNGLIVTDDTCELDVLKHFHLKAKYSNQKMSLTIAPTLSCNFSCPYCYEKARSGKMSRSTQDAIIRYVDKKMEEGTKDIDVTWYGGEPLLYPRIVDYITSNLQAASQKRGVDIGFSMVTNGYLLDADIVKMLMRNRIDSIQVTIDGLEENHNTRRPHKKNTDSFQKIIDNLKLFIDTPIRVNIRMNIDRKNYRDYASLQRMVESIGQAGVKIALYPALVEHLNQADTQRDDFYMSANEYEEFLSDSYIHNMLADEGLAVINNRRYYCSAELSNTYVIDERGNCYKCWDEIGIPERCCFNINEPSKINYPPMLRFMLDSPFSNPSCRQCVFLPLCFGGCRFQKQVFGKLGCNFTDQTMRSYLEKKYFSIT